MGLWPLLVMLMIARTFVILKLQFLWFEKCQWVVKVIIDQFKNFQIFIKSLYFEVAVLTLCLPAFNRTWQKEGWIEKNKGQKGRQEVSTVAMFAEGNCSRSFLHFCGRFERDWTVVFKGDEGFSTFHLD